MDFSDLLSCIQLEKALKILHEHGKYQVKVFCIVPARVKSPIGRQMVIMVKQCGIDSFRLITTFENYI